MSVRSSSATCDRAGCGRSTAPRSVSCTQLLDSDGGATTGVATVAVVSDTRMPVSAVRAVRGAIQLEVDERDHVLSSTRELVSSVLGANSLNMYIIHH